jgi:pyruvate dehydrogenase E1 component alpha subunit
MFERFDPREHRRLSILKPDGSLDMPIGVPRLPDERALEAYRLMVLARQADEWAVNLNRQGRMPTYPPNKGQEANGIGAMLALRRDDWFVPAFRELGAWLARGVPLHQVYLYWYGNELGSRLPIEAYHTLPVAVPVGSQPLHAVGLAYAEKLARSERIAITFMGEGATSAGAVHEALNLAGVWGVGVIFYVQNNQWAISLPTHRQTASVTVAEKAFAYGFEGLQVDGNDLFAVHAAVSMAAEAARRDRRPVLIEGFTYRLGAHTTADDPKRYRDEEEVRVWSERDPLLRLERYLTGKGLLDSDHIEAIRAETLSAARRAFEQAEATPDPSLEDGFRFMYAEMPEPLGRQLRRRRSLAAVEGAHGGGAGGDPGRGAGAGVASKPGVRSGIDGEPSRPGSVSIHSSDGETALAGRRHRR